MWTSLRQHFYEDQWEIYCQKSKKNAVPSIFPCATESNSSNSKLSGESFQFESPLSNNSLSSQPLWPEFVSSKPLKCKQPPDYVTLQKENDTLRKIVRM